MTTNWRKSLGAPGILAAAAMLALTGCSSSASDAAPATKDATASATSAASTTASSSAKATSSTSTTSTSAPTTTAAPKSADISSVQIVIQSSNEVSPGTLQYGDSVYLDAKWMAISAGATYDGEKCAAVITLVDPGGNVLKTDRQSTCTGSTDFRIYSTENGTGQFTIKASIEHRAIHDQGVHRALGQAGQRRAGGAGLHRHRQGLLAATSTAAGCISDHTPPPRWDSPCA